MIEIRNLMFQPLTFHLACDAGGIHLGSRERRTIDDGELSDEIRAAALRGFVSLSEIVESPLPGPLVETAVCEPCPGPSRKDDCEPAGDEPRVSRKKGNAR